MEILVAGEWRKYREGTQPLTVRAESARNLPPGRFLLSREEKRLRLEWRPDKLGQGGTVTREAVIR
jgi:hypothetical protein